MDSVEPIAIIGLACRLPGARNVEEFWLNLVNGKESISFHTEDELRAAGVSETELANPDYVRAAPMMPDVDMFDADLFGMTAHEARLCDPQIRVFLEMCHAGLEDSGYDPFGLAESVGVFGTVGANGYLRRIVASRPELVEGGAGIRLFALNQADSLATLASYKLDLRGPSMTVLTACSSSLVAAHLAAQALRAGECDMALAGGAAVELPLGHGHMWTPAGIYSSDGHCRPFDASASGTLFGSGAGVVVLKRLEDAIASGDNIRAVIRGSAVNNDGADKVSFAAPSMSGQTSVAAEAMALAGVHPAELEYVEANASGTALGDSVEAAGLAEAFAALSDDPLPTGGTAIGSVKSNIGHLNAAAGIAGLIKTVLMLDREAIVPSLNVRDLNPRLGLDATPFAVATELKPWRRRPGRERYASVSSLGVGGTNAHLVLSDTEKPPPELGGLTNSASVLVWSGRSDKAVEELRGNLAAFFSTRGAGNFTDAVATLQYGRTAHPVRSAAICSSADDAVAALTDRSRQITGRVQAEPSIVFLVPDHTAYRPRMATGLYGRVRSFTIAMDEAVELFEQQAGARLYDAWSSDRPISDPAIVQPLLFSVQYALCSMWRNAGLEPDAVLGQGIGELVAATVAGVFELPEATSLVYARARRMTDEVTARFSPRPQRIPVYSTTTGGALRESEAVDPAFWTDTRTRPDRFGSALSALLERPDRLLFEIGPGGAMSELVRRQDAIGGSAQTVVGLPAGSDDQLAMLHVAAQLWVNGAPLDWETVGQPSPIRKVTMPGYPYQRDRHWVDPGPVAGATARVDTPVEVTVAPVSDTVTAAAVADTPASPDAETAVSPFATVDWVPRRRPAATAASRGNALVLLPDDPTRALDVLLALERAGYRAIRVRTGTRFGEEPGEFEVRPGRPDDLERVVATVRERGVRLAAFVHAAGVAPLPTPTGTELPGQLEIAFGSALALARLAITPLPGQAPARFVVITSGSVDVSGSDRLEPAKATVLGLVRSLLAEAPELCAGVIDIADRVGIVDVAAELRLGQPAPVVALRGRRRWVPVECPLDLLETDGDAIRDRGVYLITGGMGVLGLTVARALAGTGQRPTIVLMGHRDLLAGGDSADPEVSRVAAAVADLRALGARVHSIAADLTDAAAVWAAVADINAEFGPVNGLFQVTGIPGDRGIAFGANVDAAAVLAPTTTCAQNLADVFADASPLDFVVLFSSRAGTDRLVVGADYAAANAFLDALAAVCTLASGNVLSIGWPVWQGLGMEDHDSSNITDLADPPAPALTWEAEVAASSHWVLDEHRVGPKPLMPATAYLDLVVGLFTDRLAEPGDAIVLTDVVFHAPLSADSARPLRVEFTPAPGGGFGFTAWSGMNKTMHVAASRHVTGHIAGLAEPAAKINLDALQTRLAAANSGAPPPVPADLPFTLGPRWHNVSETLRAGDEKLLRIELMDAFAADLADHRLHPALLDTATAAIRATGEGSFVPFTYPRMVVHADLPGTFYSHVRRRSSTPDTAVGDVDLVTEDGLVLVSIEGFTMRREDFGAGWDEPEPDSRRPGKPASAAHGLDPEEGTRLLMRLLNVRAGTSILIRPHANGRPVPPAAISGHTSMPEDPAPATELSRPVTAAVEIASPPADAPQAAKGLPDRLRELWALALGAEPSAAEDDFFDVGGDSLAAIELMAKIKASFGIELSVGILLDTRTFGDLLAVIEERLDCPHSARSDRGS
jgi:phthiocerol/phenolphthiocerol synthesis type-I polyketide synthase E